MYNDIAMDYEQALVRKLNSMFEGKGIISKAISILNSYGAEEHERELPRVKLAMLKLAGSNLKEMDKFTDMGKKVYGDVLAWAEYPRQSRKWSIPEGPEKQNLVKEDKEEYEKWLNT
jgi:hypothetical protein